MTDYEKIKALFQEIGVRCEYCDDAHIIDFPDANEYFECFMSFDENGKFKRVAVME